MKLKKNNLFVNRKQLNKDKYFFIFSTPLIAEKINNVKNRFYF